MTIHSVLLDVFTLASRVAVHNLVRIDDRIKSFSFNIDQGCHEQAAVI